MSSFITNLMDRSESSTPDIQPRLRGKYERGAAPSKSFLATEEMGDGVEATGKEAEAPVKRMEVVQKNHVIKHGQYGLKNISPLTVQRPLQENYFSDTRPERPQRYKPSYSVIVASPVQQSLEHTQGNVDVQPNTAFIERSALPNNVNDQQEAAASQPKVLSAITTKEIQKPGPLVKPIVNDAFPESPMQKTEQQSPIASVLHKQSVKHDPSRTINISIGRVEVRVSQPPAAPAKTKKESVAIMGLDEYLQKRNQRGQ